MSENPPPSKVFADQVEGVKNRLDSVSPSFCLAKWLQSTLHLHRGLTHSCHHPEAHPIPLREISSNVAALHNTQEKIRARAQMLQGERPRECQYCWNIEDLGKGSISDRTLKSGQNWAWPSFAETLKNPLSDRMLPKYLEVSFSRACNFKCSYCSPMYSSTWAKDVLQGGAYPGREYDEAPSTLHDPFTEETNPYIKAFWEWWPELKNSLHTFRITGGEPLLSPNTFRVLEMLCSDPAPDLAFSINSNLGVPSAKVERLISAVADLVENRKISRFDLFTSLEAWGKRAEYIRHGLNTELFLHNVEQILEKLPSVSITFMVTFNALSATSFLPFLERVVEWRKKFSVKEVRPSPIFLDISYLRYPTYQAPNVLGPEYQEHARAIVQFMERYSSSLNSNSWGFRDWEIAKAKRLVEWMRTPLAPEALQKERAAFFRFFSEHDRRRNTSFVRTFPEMVGFWEECKVAAGGKPSPYLQRKLRGLAARLMSARP